MDIAAARLRAALNPGLAARISEFDTALAALRAVPQRQVTVAVIGLVPGAGRSTVSGLTALCAAGYSDRRVVVIDTAASGPHPVTDLLGGDVADGRLPVLMEVPAGSGVSRRSIGAALTPGAAAPLLSLAPGDGEFTPQALEGTLERLRYRADLVVIDTPVGPSHPVLHAVLDRVDHFLLVVRGDGHADAQVDAGLGWLASAPGRRRPRPVSVVAVSRGLRGLRAAGPVRPTPVSVATPEDPPGVIVVARDEALRRRRLDRISRRSAVAGLRLAAVAVSGPSQPLEG